MDNYYKLARKMFWSLLAFISLLTYVVEIRSLFNSLYGAYFVGLLDGFVITVFGLTVVFYTVSKTKSD